MSTARATAPLIVAIVGYALFLLGGTSGLAYAIGTSMAVLTDPVWIVAILAASLAIWFRGYVWVAAAALLCVSAAITAYVASTWHMELGLQRSPIDYAPVIWSRFLAGLLVISVVWLVRSALPSKNSKTQAE